MKKLVFLISMIISVSLFSQTWNYVSSTGTTFILYGMSFPPEQSNIGYACGMQYTYNADGVIVKTTDGGENWTQILPVSGDIDGLEGIWFIDNNTGFAGGWNNYFIKTTDGGASWTPVTCGSGVWYYTDVIFYNSNNGVAVGYMNDYTDQSVFVTENGGNTWTPATSGSDCIIYGICYADQNTLYAVNNSNDVLKSTDMGHNWSVIYTLPALPMGVNFADPNFGVVGAEEKIFSTTDGGATWTTFTTGYENFSATLAHADGTAYVGGTDERIYFTSDYGASWSLENSSGSSHLYRIREVNDGGLFACGSQGTILYKASPFGADFTASSDTVCEGSTVDFTDMSDGSIVSWSWTFEGGTPATSSAQNPTVTYNTAGDYDVTLVISDGTITDTSFKDNYINVRAIPVAPDTPSGLTNVCAGEVEEYSINAVPGADTYIWEVLPSDAGTISGDGTIATFTSNEDWQGNYTIKVKAGNMCGYSSWSSILSCVLNFVPYHFQLSESDRYCEGGDGVEITLDGSEIDVDYELYLDGYFTGTVVAGTGSPISFGYQTEPGGYTVIGYTDFCSNQMYGTPYVYVDFPPEAASTPQGEQNICSPDTTEYYANPVTYADTLYWYLDPYDAGEIIGSGETISIAWNDFTGTASLSVQGANDCGVGDESDALVVTLSTKPEVEITGMETVCDQSEEEYSVAGGDAFAWTVTGGDIINGAGTSSVVVEWGEPGNGSLHVVVTNNDMCSDSSEMIVTIDDCTGINETESNNIIVYPNPFSNEVNIIADFKLGAIYSLSIRNLLGQEVYQSKFAGNGENQQITIGNELPAGQYILVLTSSGQQKFQKLIMKE